MDIVFFGNCCGKQIAKLIGESNVFEKTSYKQVLHTNIRAFLTRMEDKCVYFVTPEDVVAGVSGIEFASKLRKQDGISHIVFISKELTYLPYTLKNLIRPSAYILKPLDEGEVLKLLEQIAADLDEAFPKSPKIRLVLDHKKVYVPVSEILFFTSQNKKIICYIKEGKHLEFYSTLRELEEQHGEYFFRCHSGFLVNKSKVKTIADGVRSLNLDGFTGQIPISKKYKEEAKLIFFLEQTS